MKTKLFTLIMIVLIFSCSKEENGISNSDIRTELGLKKQQLSIKEIDNIKKKTEPIYFNSIEEAKEFLDITSNDFEDTEIKPSENKVKIMFRQGPCDKKKGSAKLTTGNLSIYMYLNVTINYDGKEVSDMDSNISGFTLGLSYDHVSSNYSVSSDNNINFTVQGIMNYNIVVEGIGTVFRQNVTLEGSYNPCNNSGSITRCPPYVCGGLQ